jgi:hypothetical protein
VVVRLDVEADVDSVEPKTVCMKDDHSSESSEPRPSILISGVDTTGSGAKERLLECLGGSVEERRPRDGEGRKFQSGDIERREGCMAESREVERTAENRIPSSPTSSEPIPPHSIRLFLSMGVPRPTYLTSGHDPRTVEPTARDGLRLGGISWVGDADDPENEMDREDGEVDRGEVSWGNDEMEAGGEDGGERQDKSSSKSSKPPNVGTSIISGKPCTVSSS